MTRISVVIPCYNRAHLLGRAVESVLRQSYDKFELLIVDDGSTDSTQELLDRLADPRIEIIRHETNRGASAARNTGIRHAEGEFIAFLDSDDVWLPFKLEKQLAAFDAGSTRLGVVYTKFRKVDWHYEPRIHRWQGDIAARILLNNCVGTASTPMIRRRCFETSGDFDEEIHGTEDWDLWIRIAADWEFELLSENLVDYYPQPIGLTADRGGSLRAHRALFEKHAERIAALDDATRAKHYFYRGRMYFAHRQFRAGFGSFVEALQIDRSVAGAIGNYLFIEGARKLIDRVQRGVRVGKAN